MKTPRLKPLARAIPRRLASVRVGLLLLCAIFAFALVAAFYPARQIVGLARSVGQALALQDVSVGALSFQERFESPPFIVLVIVLILSVCCSLYFRIRGERKRMRAERNRRWRQGTPGPRGGPLGAAADAVRRELRRRGYRTEVACGADAVEVAGTRGGAGVWGSVLLHASVLLVCAAVVLSKLASFAASVHLTEGQAFDARVDRYGVQKAGAWYRQPAQPLTFRLIRVEPQYQVNGATTTATIVLPTVNGKPKHFLPPFPVYLNHGLQHAGLTIHQGVNIGYAPQVSMVDAQGEKLVEGTVRLSSSTSTLERKATHADLLEPRPGMRVELELLAERPEPRNPVLHVRAREDGKLVFDRSIPLHRAVSDGGYTVRFDGLRRWSQLEIVDDPAPLVLVAATLLGSLGLGLRLLCVRRRVAVSLRWAEPRVVLALTGSSEKFQRTFEEELEALRAALTRRLSAPATVAPPQRETSWTSLAKQS